MTLTTKGKLEDFFEEMDALIHLSPSQWKLWFDIKAEWVE